MDKVTLIATCALETRAVYRIEDAIPTIISTFEKEFPNDNFHSWNTELNEQLVNMHLQQKKGASTIYIKNFILELWG